MGVSSTMEAMDSMEVYRTTLQAPSGKEHHHRSESKEATGGMEMRRYWPTLEACNGMEQNHCQEPCSHWVPRMCGNIKQPQRW